MPSSKLVIFNFVSFQLLWWACVLSAGTGKEDTLLCLIGLLTLLHLHWVEVWEQSLPLILTALTGCIFDQVVYSMGWVSFDNQSEAISYIPTWMIGLWLAFACTLNVSMRWLQHQLTLAALLGAIFGPLAYVGAEKLGAITLPGPTSDLAWIALEWGLVLPLLLWIRATFNATLQVRPV